MTPTSLRALCLRAVELSDKATPGTWTWEDGPPTLYSGRTPLTHGMNLLGRLDLDWNGKNNMDFICAARTDLPALARALLELMPYVRHANNCTIGLFDDDNQQRGCSCGLSSALSGMDEEGERANG